MDDEINEDHDGQGKSLREEVDGQQRVVVIALFAALAFWAALTILALLIFF